jgi:conjugal transfer pilus assembly protein TraB
MKKLLIKINELKQNLKKFFLADDKELDIVRKKHLRLGLLVTTIFLIACYFIQNSDGAIKHLKSSGKLIEKSKKELKTSSALEKLTDGTSNELIWTEIQGQAIDALKTKQQTGETIQKAINDKLNNEKVSKQDMDDTISELESKIEQKYREELAAELEKLKTKFLEYKQNNQQSQQNQRIETKSFKTKKQSLKLGEYIPANSYAQAKLISGVDAGVGMNAESNPRNALLRITGEVVSAGLGGKFLKTNKLIGCQMSLKAVGDISSEKVYLDGVVMSCAKNANTFIEIPVKAYVSSMGKAGVRGEIVSREGDMVLKSFVAGIASGFGNGINEFSRPQTSLLGSNNSLSDGQKARNLLNGGLGSGLNSGSNSLAEFFIKRAEQYQPVISVNEGVEVNIVFIEGFSLNEETDDEKSK